MEDRVNIEFQLPSGKSGILRLLDVQGRELRRTEVFDFQSLLQWDMRAYPTGVYTVELQREDKRPVSKKLIVP